MVARKKILMVLNYYYPYVSGLSEVARLLAEKYASEGHSVTVLCSNHAKLQGEEMVNGVRVVRAPILLKIGKGTVSLAFIRRAVQMGKEADVINLHLPMLESGLLTSIMEKHKLIVTYQCDLDIGKGVLNNFIRWVMDTSCLTALKKAQKVLVTTMDYGLHSRLARHIPDKLVEVRTPIIDYQPISVEKQRGIYTIGFCGRIVAEKGIDVLLRAFRLIREKRSDVRLLIAGDYSNVAGGSIYPQLAEYVADESLPDVHFLGKIPAEKMAEFYSGLDIFCLPSIYPLEAFGMVQVEAMLCGIPVVASDLYGVRTIVANTGMGVVHKRGDAEDLARCIMKVLDNRENYIKPRSVIHDLYSTEQCAADYMSCYDAVKKR